MAMRTSAADRIRLAKKSRRKFLWKKYRKTILQLCIVFILVVAGAILTPIGPNYVWDRIQNDLMEGQQQIKAKAVKDTYWLARMYGMTMREDNAMERYDDIIRWYYGFSITDYIKSADNAWETRRQALAEQRKRPTGKAPFVVPEEAMPYVVKSIVEAGKILAETTGSQIRFILYSELIVNDLMTSHPDAIDSNTQKFVEDTIKRFRKEI